MIIRNHSANRICYKFNQEWWIAYCTVEVNWTDEDIDLRVTETVLTSVCHLSLSLLMVKIKSEVSVPQFAYLKSKAPDFDIVYQYI